MDGCVRLESLWAELDTHRHLVGRFSELRAVITEDALLSNDAVIEITKRLMIAFPNPLLHDWKTEFTSDFRRYARVMLEFSDHGGSRKRGADRDSAPPAYDGWVSRKHGQGGKGSRDGKGGRNGRRQPDGKGGNHGKGGKGAPLPKYPGVCHAYSTRMSDGCKFAPNCRYIHKCVCCKVDHIAAACKNWDVTKDSRIRP